MRYNEILSEDELFEINMSPTNLQKLAAAIPDARAGLEFEMCVPGAADADGDYDQEPDYDQDQRCRSIQDAFDFFYDGDWNSRRSCESMRDKMQEQYLEWLDEKISEEWNKRGEDFLHDWIANNVDEEEWDNDDGDPESSREERLENFVANVHGDPSSDHYQAAYDEYREENQESWDESDWLDEADLSHMSEIEDAYSMTWPYWTDPESGGDVDVDEVVDSFGSAIGRGVVNAGDYHSMRGTDRASSNANNYIVERDGSIEPEDGDGGLEFVSPPLPIPEMIKDLKNVVKWATQYGCYTGDEHKTGLHMNISVPNYGMDRLDYLKLTILLGDEHVLKEFGRMGNTFCKSAMGKVQDRVRQQPDDAKALLDKMKEHLDAAATKAIHNGSTDKYTSINTKDNRVEFRSPGGDWLGEYKADPGKLVNTMLRMVVALDAALDPDKYRQEYQTKLYKLLSANSKGDDTIKYFSEYVAGKIPKAALRSFVKQAQLERDTQRGKFDGKKMWWKVWKNGKAAGNYGASVEVVATSKEEARQKAAKGWGEPLLVNTLSKMDAEVLRPYVEQSDKSDAAQTGTGRYELFDRRTGEAVPDTEFSARNQADVNTRLDDYINFGPHRVGTVDARLAFGARPVASPTDEPGDERVLDNPLRPTGPGPWEIYNRSTGNSVMNVNYNGEAVRDRGTAQRLAMTNIAPSQSDRYGVRTIGATDTVFNIYADNGRITGRFETQDEAYEEAQRLADENNITVHVGNGGLRVATATPQSSSGASESNSNWIIVDRATGETLNTVSGASRDQAQAVLHDTARRNGVRPADLSLQASEDIPEVPMDVAQNFPPDRTDGRTINFGNQFSGQWRVMLDGEEVWRFRGVGNNQADANRIAQTWLQDQRRQGSLSPAPGADVEVLPVMI